VAEDTPRIILASASPRRAHILRTLVVPFRVVVSNLDETLEPGEAGAAAVERLARGKAEAVARTEPLPVLAADTEVVHEGRILGKPASPEAAVAMLRGLQGHTHEVVTGVCVAAAGRLVSGIERSLVTLSPMSEDELRWYVGTGEPLDKAGGYHVDGRGALFVESVTGSPSNVAGLPVRLVLRLLREAGVALFDPASSTSSTPPRP
jgi:septum formation protein